MSDDQINTVMDEAAMFLAQDAEPSSTAPEAGPRAREVIQMLLDHIDIIKDSKERARNDALRQCRNVVAEAAMRFPGKDAPTADQVAMCFKIHERLLDLPDAPFHDRLTAAYNRSMAEVVSEEGAYAKLRMRVLKGELVERTHLVAALGHPRAAMRKAVHDWINWDAGTAIKLTMTPDMVQALIDRLCEAALHDDTTEPDQERTPQ